MYKKLLISLILLALVNYLFGCYYQEQMNPSTYEFDENNDIKLTTRDTTYHFKGDNYYLKNDTLFGKALKPLDERSALKLQVEIPKEHIIDLKVEKENIPVNIGLFILFTTIIIWGLTYDFNFMRDL